MYTETSTLSPTRTWLRMCQHRTVCSVQSHRARTSHSHRIPNYCAHGSMPLLLADGRHWHHRQQGGERSKCLRSSLSCKASAVALQTHASFAPPLRLSGEPPDSRRGGAVTFNLSRCASCEGARESRGSHAAGLEMGCMWRSMHSWSWDFW